MAGKRKTPKLRQKDGCFVTDIYRPNGQRTTVSFGPPDGRTEGEIYAAFGQWLDLFSRHPHKALSFGDPYDAIAEAISPTTRTVGQFAEKYLESVEQHLPPLRDGRMNPTLGRINQLKPFLDPYAEWPVAEFGPDELKAVQDAMLEYRYFHKNHEDEPIGYTRTSINRMINSVHKMWQWGVGREITTEAQRQRLKEVRPLRAGRSPAKDRLKRVAVTQGDFDKTVGSLTSVTADMLQIIWRTAMRPSEVCRMRPSDIIRDNPECWLYIPGRDVSLVGDHKTAHHQRVRAIPLTPSVQAILKPRIKSFTSTACIFSPADAVQELVDRRSVARKTPLSCGNSPGTNRQEHPMIKPGEEYTPRSLRVALRRACKRAGVERFTPYDLRRTVATRVSAKLGKEAAKLLLGHVSTSTTDIYLLRETQESMEVAKQLDAIQG